MAVSKRLRYEILRRDGHACRYCGAGAPEAKLTVDHVRPVALGGTDDPSNLVAACGDCNSGKSSATPDATLIDDVRTDSDLWAQAKASVAEGRRADAYQGLDAEVAAVEEAWGIWGYEADGRRHGVPKDPQWKSNVRVWILRGLPLERLLELIPVAMNRPGVELANRWRYFAGCAWRTIEKIEVDTEAAYEELKGAPPADPAPELRPLPWMTARRAVDLIRPNLPSHMGDRLYDEVLVAAAVCHERVLDPAHDDLYVTLAEWILDHWGLDVDACLGGGD